jgi:uncharacterized protein
MYSTSFYNLFFEIDNILVVFNTLSGSVLEIDRELEQLLESGETQNIPVELHDDLLSLGIIIPSGKDELDEYLKRYEVSKERRGALTLKLFLATSCNLGCAYCYQSAPGKPGNVIQRAELDKLLIWIQNEFSTNGITGIEIEFYGGEPLLARLQLPRFIREVNRISAVFEAKPNYSIVTNATLMDDELIDLFIENQVTMQITLDGDQETHDERRNWKTTGKGSFDQIFKALEKICGKGAGNLVRLRMNVDQKNFLDVKPLAEKSRSLGIGTFTCGRIHFREKKVEYEVNMISTQEFEENFDLEIFRILQPLGYADSPSNLDSKDTCLYHWKRGFSVSPELNLYKCDELIDFPEYRVGWIDEGGRLQLIQGEYEKAVSRKPTDFEHCSTCRYLPQCGSGCSIRALNAKGTPHLNFCEATYESVQRRVAAYVKASDEGMTPIQSESRCGSCHCGT